MTPKNLKHCSSEKCREKLINEGDKLTMDKAIQIVQIYEYCQKQLSSMTLSGASGSNVDVLNRRRPNAGGARLKTSQPNQVGSTGQRGQFKHAGTTGLNTGKTSVRHTGKYVTTAGKGTISRNFADLNHLWIILCVKLTMTVLVMCIMDVKVHVQAKRNFSLTR